ncbi:hypothetical protein ACHAXN_006850 [Cyclotella atomus]
MSTAWTRCSIPTPLNISTSSNEEVLPCNSGILSIYGPSQLETYLHSQLRNDVKNAKLNVYYPGRWMEPCSRGCFRIEMQLSTQKSTCEWRFHSNAAIVSAHFESVRSGNGNNDSNASIADDTAGDHCIYWESTEETDRDDRVYDHVLLLHLGGHETFGSRSHTLTLEMDTRSSDETNHFVGSQSSENVDENVRLCPPPCICTYAAQISRHSMQIKSWEWKPTNFIYEKEEVDHPWSKIYQCWTLECPEERDIHPGCTLHHQLMVESTWVFPHQMSLCNSQTVYPVEMSIPGNYSPNAENSRLYDFQKEIFGKVKITIATADLPGDKSAIKLRVGETVSEAMNDDEEHFEQSTELVCFQHEDALVFTSAHLLAFRFARIVMADSGSANDVTVECIARSPILSPNGIFSAASASDDSSTSKDTCHLLNDIWQTAAYTLQHCIHHNFIVDGIKRDRLPWAGDLAVSIMANAYSFADVESIRCTLVVLGRCGINRFLQLNDIDENVETGSLLGEGHVNGVVDFSLWFIISHWLYQRYFGDVTFLMQEWPTIRLRLLSLIKYCRDEASGFLNIGNDAWVFIDWSESVEKNTALQILWWWALECAKLLTGIISSQNTTSLSNQNDYFSNLLHTAQSRLESSFASREDVQASYSRHAHILGVISSLNSRLVENASGKWWDPDTSDEHWQALLKVRKLDNQSLAALLGSDLDHVGTPFMKHLECLAISRLGNRCKALTTIRRYWGGMLRTGATTFYEALDEKETEQDIASFYDRPYARSMCHAWGSGPCALLPEIMLGLRPLSDGWKIFQCDPLEECPSYVSASVQTKYGIIGLKLDPVMLCIDVPNGTTMILMERRYEAGTHVIPRDELLSTESVRKWSQKYRHWIHHPKHVIPSNPKIPGYADVTMTDVPTVYQRPGDTKYYMSFVGFDGICYQSFVAESNDLISWEGHRLAMAAEGPDEGGVVLGAYLYESYDLEMPRVLKRINGRFFSLYGAYSKKGGYEIDPGHQGLASSEDGLFWKREKNASILSIFESDVGDWEKSSIYQPWLVEHNGTYYNFYNAKQMPQWIEQIGLATSSDLHEWTRLEDNPILGVTTDGYDKQFCADAKVFRDNAVNHWVMFYFGVGKGGAHITIAFSKNLLHWVRDPFPLYYSGGNSSGLDKSYAHKISVIQSKNVFYIYYCAVGNDGRGIGLITSDLVESKSDPCK